MLIDAKCGTLVGIESHMYEDCPAMFTVCTSEKSKLLQISSAGFKKYMKPFLKPRHDRVLSFLSKQEFMKEFKTDLFRMLPLVLMIEQKKVLPNTLVVEQNDICKYIYWVAFGNFSLMRTVNFID